MNFNSIEFHNLIISFLDHQHLLNCTFLRRLEGIVNSLLFVSIQMLYVKTITQNINCNHYLHTNY